MPCCKEYNWLYRSIATGGGVDLDKKAPVAYWNVYDTVTGQLIEKDRAIADKAMPLVGDLLIGIPGRSQAIVRNLKFSGKKDNLPCYDVYI